jgi:PAS domain S-box-containing protein
MKVRSLRSFVEVIVVVVIYFCAARLGLSLAFLQNNVSSVWPATGFAIAATLWLGYRAAAGVLIGTILVSLGTGVSFATGAGIGVGNTLEALTAAFLLRRFVASDRIFDRAQDVLKFVVIAPILSTIVSATTGNLSLCLGGASPWGKFGSLWVTWWSGDAVGALVVAPLLLTSVEFRSQNWSVKRWAEAVSLLVLLSLVASIVFRALLHPGFPNYPLAHLTTPFLMWAAFRFGPSGSAAALAVLSAIATWGTTRGLGPFAQQDRNEALLLLQAFIAAVAVTVLVVAAIITERRTAQGTIAFLASIVESTDDAVIGKARDGTIVSWNRGAERIYGYTADEAIGRSISIVIPPDRADELARLVRPPSKGQPVEQYDTQRVRKDGRIIDVSLTISPIVDSSGKISGTSTVARDVSGRKQAEREREQLLVMERKARELAEAANRLKSDFLGIVSHELRSPLNAILGWTNLLRRGTLDDRSTARALETVERSAQSQAKMIEDLLDVSRMIGGKVKLDIRPVCLGSVIAAAVQAIAPAAADKRIALEISLDEDAIVVAGDSNRLEQVVSNLLTNAVKFTPMGGRIQVLLRRADGLAEIRVSDNGEGIDPEFLPHVFDRFRQADSSYTRRHSGLGLGLSIVWQLVESHRGSVEATSSGPGQGATFTVKLPLTAECGTELHLEGSQMSVGDAPGLEGVRVLVVDDDPETVEVIRATLELHEACVRTAESACEALRVLEQWTPEVIISDIGMPNEDGYSLMSKVRIAKEGTAISAVALTGYAGLEDADRAREAGYEMHLSKPIAPDDLVQVVGRLARKH